LSRNLVVKQVYTVIDQEAKRVIDANSLIQKRMEELAEKQAEGEAWEASELSACEEDGEASGAGIAKAKEEASLILGRAAREAEDTLAKSRAEAEEILQQARAAAEAEGEKIRTQAWQSGYDEGMAKAREKEEELRREFSGRHRQLEEVYEEQLQDMEPHLVDTITDIYEHIFEVELGTQREILEHLISNAMRKLEGSREFIIHVSKEDYSFVNMQKKQILAGAVGGNSNVDVVEDLTLSKNDCMIETDGGIFDCGLGTQLSELKNKLMLLAWTKAGDENRVAQSE